MKVYVLDNGFIENDLACLIAMPKLASNEDRNPKADWVRVPVYSLLIEHPNGLVLIDTACHPDSMTKRWNESQKNRNPYGGNERTFLPATLGRLGYKPQDVKHVIMSHLHIDHAGCLEMFTNAKVYVHENEFTNVMKLYGLNGDMGAYVRKDIEGWINAKLNWQLLEQDVGDIEILDGIKILNFGPGHTFGMLGVMLSLKETGNVIVVTDALNRRENLGPPILYPGLAYDTIGYRKTAERIQRLKDQYNAQVWFGHDMEQFKTLTKSDDGFYK